MHKHLRAWRLLRGLSLEEVGAILHKRHSTISRWERGLMKLSTDDLEALAEIYGCTATQLAAPPAAANLVSTLDSLQQIACDMDPDILARWLQIGRDLKR